MEQIFIFFVLLVGLFVLAEYAQRLFRPYFDKIN